ncbi:glycosyltransferase [filamentous cyanobacterium CCP1]|nr:glycosyltransferase [filamentous cyanobacterium CCP2]PSB68358.1 glycosyltransferase [filamentous cyanobacterium CCP1]
MKPILSDRSLHVVVYTDSAGLGGAEISLGHLVGTVSKEIQITVVGVSEPIVNFIADRRPTTNRRILSDRGFFSFLQHIYTFYGLRPDIIHINLCSPWAGAIGLMAALLLPQVRTVRVDQLPLRTTDILTLWRTRLLSLRVDAHVAVGEASARRMEDFYALGRNTVISIPNGVPDFAPSGAVQSAFTQAQGNQAQGKWMVVGSIGRLDAMKAHDVFIQAIAEVEGVAAVILGEGEQRSSLERLAVELGVSDRVKLMGWVEQPQSYLANFDVVAMPSRSEGFPLAMVEAMLAARPVIATRVGSMPEAILDHQTGILIEKNDVQSLVRALQELRDNPKLRIQLGNQARNFALAQFTAEAMATKYERLWQQSLSNPRSPRFRVSRPPD